MTDQRPLHVLFVMDPLERIRVAGDSTFMLMVEAQRRGWTTSMCTPGDLFAEGGSASARHTPVVASLDAPHFRVEAVSESALSTFDMVWMRKDPPFDMAYIFATYLLDLVPRSTLVLNAPDALRNRNEKMFALAFPELCPRTLITRDIVRARSWIRAEGRVVLKPWDGNGGRGVVVTHADDANLGALLELLSDEGRRELVVQEYLPAVVRGDKRIVLVDGEPRGWIARVPQAGDHRGNMHVGARAEAFNLSERDREICAKLGPVLKREGLVFVGIDVIGDHLTEINVTSPTGIREISRLQGIDLEPEIMSAAYARWSALVEAK